MAARDPPGFGPQIVDSERRLPRGYADGTASSRRARSMTSWVWWIPRERLRRRTSLTSMIRR